MAVAVFDADVLIAFLARSDAHHAQAVERVRHSLAPGMRRMLCVVNYSEILIGPLEARGSAGAETVDAMLARLGIETIDVDTDLASRAAAVRAQTKLKLPDAYALATAMQAHARGHDEVRIESFDKRVGKAYADLRG